MPRFTIADVFASLVLGCVVVGGCFPSLSKPSETARRVKCQSNLSQIGKALLLYSNENQGAYPQTHYIPDRLVSVGNEGHADADPFITTRVNNIPSAMFLLMRTMDMTSEVFVCPSGSAGKDTFDGKTAMQRGNFTGKAGSVTKNLSYGFVNVYPSHAALANGYPKIIIAFASDFAVAADLSPERPGTVARVKVGDARPVVIKANSKNHREDGQNVLYADGHAEFQQTPLCGVDNDHIYTSHTATADPANGNDSVLLISTK